MTTQRSGSIKQIQEVVAYLEPRFPKAPEIAIVLGSGLGAFVDMIKNPVVIPYSEIPHFHKPSIEGHQGCMVHGEVNGVVVVALQGRWHYYEGHSMDSIAIPTRVMATLGAHTIVLTNAAGGVNLQFKAGDLMILEDHINLMGDNPLTGKESPLFGPRFPDMSETYCLTNVQILEATAKKLGFSLKKGVYGGLRGPTYETPAEVRMLRTLGCDAVGMSTVPEAIAARHMGMRVVGISCITNMAAGIEKKTLDHAEVTETASRVMKEFSKLIAESLPEIHKNAVPALSKKKTQK